MTTQKSSFSFTKAENILVLFICLMHLVACFPQKNKDFNIQSPQLSTRTVTDMSLPFHEQWRRSNLLLFNTEADRLYLYGDQLFFVSYEDGGNTRRLEALNTKTGTLLWKTEPLPSLVNSLSVDGQRVYLALSSKIIVYDHSTGDMLWEDSLLGGRTTYWVRSMDDTLLVYSEEDISPNGYEEQVIRKYDSQNGFLKSIDHINISQKNSSLLLMTPNFDYWTDVKSLWSINNITNQEQWRIKIDNRVEYNPLLIDSKLIFASGIFSDVICIDNLSGRQIWKYRDKIVSNLAAKQRTIYAIRTDATIVGIDSTTGKEVGYIGIEPRLTETSSRSHAYIIAVSEDLLFVYYGDSQELIVFQSDKMD